MKSARLGLASCLIIVFSSFAAAQPPAGQQPATEKPVPVKREPNVYRLRHTTATELASVLSQVFRGQQDARFAVDARTNSIIVLSPATDLEAVEKLIKAMDVERADAAAPRHQVKILHLAHAEANTSLQRELEVVFQNRSASFAIDHERKVVIVSGEPSVIETAEQVLRELDAAAAAKSAGPEVQVRIIWLVSGPTAEAPVKVPADLNDVVAELAKLGIDKPWLAAQGIVNAAPGARFQLDGSAKLDASCTFNVSGTLLEKQPNPAVEIEIRAMKQVAPQAPPNMMKQLCNLHTQITTPLGHAVVLGVTPTDGTTSVFVVQVLKKEAKGQPGK